MTSRSRLTPDVYEHFVFCRCGTGPVRSGTAVLRLVEAAISCRLLTLNVYACVRPYTQQVADVAIS